MKKWCFSLLAVLMFMIAGAQSSEDVIRNAREFSMQGDNENAILVLKKGLEQYPNNTDIRMDLAMVYYTARRNPQALEALRPMLESEKPDEIVYQIAALVYRSELQNKEAEKLYKAGLKNHPNSGLLYNDYGQFLESDQPGKGMGIKMWEKGIELSPTYAGNYYQASRYYAAINNTVWALLYGEIFVNLDSYSSRAVEVRNILFQYYKKAYAFGLGGLNEKNEFEKNVAENLMAQKSMTAAGIGPESLAAVRARFILDWYSKPVSDKFPFRLFERHQQMLREGLFDAYNQWLFGGAANLAAFQNWTKTHAEEYQAFNKFQRQQLFVMGTNQYYK